jgi:hypothetical protein
MVPPPGSTGDEFPDFDSMSPEEQMAWLESLARRQGAKPEEFTTAADLEIAEVSPDTVIDEPGYIPYSISEKPPTEKPAAPPVTAQPELQPVMAESAAVGADELPDFLSGMEPEIPVEEFEFPVADSDPMQWLGSLSAQSEADLPESMAIAEEDTAEFLASIGEYEDVEAEPALDMGLDSAMRGEVLASEVDAGTDSGMQASVEGAADLLGGTDPMLWLESLAKRQGANLSGLDDR